MDNKKLDRFYEKNIVFYSIKRNVFAQKTLFLKVQQMLEPRSEVVITIATSFYIKNMKTF